MNESSKIIKELVNFVREQRHINRELYGLHRRQDETNQRLQSMLTEHEKWMKDHEVRLRVHYRDIKTLKER
jgi:hypothetical protein